MSKVKPVDTSRSSAKEEERPHRPRHGKDAAPTAGTGRPSIAERIGRLPPVVRRTGQYFFLVFGVYWVLAAWFSSWGDTMPWRLGLTLLGAALVYFSMFYEQENSQVDLSTAELGRLNIRYGAWWCFGGLAFTVLNRWIVEMGGGGTYVVAAGAILCGAIQMVRGYYQLQGSSAAK